MSESAKQYLPNAVLVDIITNKMYDVCKRDETHFRSRKHSHLNINRVPLDFANTLVKGYPLMLVTETATSLLTMHDSYPPAKSWKNIVCKVIDPLTYCEEVEKWRSHEER